MRRPTPEQGSIAFHAALHHTQPPLSVSPEGEVKLVLAVAAAELPNVAKCLLLLRGATFKVVIPKDSVKDGRQSDNKRKVYR